MDSTPQRLHDRVCGAEAFIQTEQKLLQYLGQNRYNSKI